MNKSKFKATVIILVFLVAAAVVAAVVTGHNVAKKDNPAAESTPTSQQSQTPEETPMPTDTPEPTESVTPTEEPDATQTPAPEPTKKPAASRKVSGSGSFSSNTGTPLNLAVDWKASALNDSQVQVTFDMYLNCYTINATPKPGGAVITIDGKTYSASTPTLTCDSATPTSVKLCSKTVTLSLAAGESLNIPVSASWAFGGKYSDVDLSTIDAAGTLSIQG